LILCVRLCGMGPRICCGRDPVEWRPLIFVRKLGEWMKVEEAEMMEEKLAREMN